MKYEENLERFIYPGKKDIEKFQNLIIIYLLLFVQFILLFLVLSKMIYIIIHQLNNRKL